MLLSYRQLKLKADAKTEPGVRKWLRERRIRYTEDAKGKPMTTTEAINQVILQTSEEEVDF